MWRSALQILAFTGMCLCASGSDHELELSLASEIQAEPVGSAVDGERHQYRCFAEVRVLIQNVSDRDQTIPTQPRGATPTLFGNDVKKTVVGFTFTHAVIAGRVIQESPFGYSPVVLRPGEYASFPPFRVPLDEGSESKEIKVIFEVDRAFGERFGWWQGAIARSFSVEYDCEIEEQPPPFPSRSEDGEPGATDNPDGAQPIREDH